MVKGLVESLHLMWRGDLLDGINSGDFLNIYGSDCLVLLWRDWSDLLKIPVEKLASFVNKS